MYLNKNEPTQEMIDFFLERTKKHIDNVRTNCNKLSKKIDMIELIDRGDIHDQSKYESEEYIPYVWLSWYYKEKDNGFKYPNKDIKNMASQAWKHHERNNSHHPGYHKYIKDMTDIDIAEMVCDLIAMSQELGGNPKEFFDNNVKKKFKFNEHQIKNINHYFNLMDA